MKTFAKIFFASTLFASNLNALPILTPSNATLSGNEMSTSTINSILCSSPGCFLAYKNEITAEEGLFIISYDTIFDTYLNGGTTYFIATPVITNPTFFLVKDGKANPAWYAFDLSPSGFNWNGVDDINFSGFWPTRENPISHISIYASNFTPIPEPSNFILTFSGIIFIIIIITLFRRK